MSIKSLTEDVRQRVDHALDEHLQRASIDESLAAAMRYGVLLGGKRIRPYLTLAFTGNDDSVGSNFGTP